MGLVFLRMLHPPTGDGGEPEANERLEKIFAGACLALIIIAAGGLLAFLVWIGFGGLQ